MAASRFLSGKGEAARAVAADVLAHVKIKAAAHASRAELSNNRFMVGIDPLAGTRRKTAADAGTRLNTLRTIQAVLCVRAYVGDTLEKRGVLYPAGARGDKMRPISLGLDR
jgi:Lon protease-like protein